jgi:phosphomannomutase
LNLSEPIISVSGLRGIVGTSLTHEIALRYASAFAAEAPAGRILITRDGRESGPMLAEVLSRGLSDLGRDVVDASVAATPTTGVLVRHLRAAGGIQISASHNPPEYNGLKLFSAEGRIIPEPAGARVMARYRQPAPSRQGASTRGRIESFTDSVEPHWSLVRKIVDLERIRKCKFKVLLDSNHGAGALVGRKLLSELGCDVSILGETPDGQFEHPPEPTAENLASVFATVREGRFDIGFCQDPDADRLAVIDETGRYLGEEYTLALCVDHRLRSQRGPIITNCSTSRMAEDLAQTHGVPFVRSAVGEANVVDAMLAQQAILGGEGNGGVIDPRVGLVRDSFVGMAMILDAMASRAAAVSHLADQLPRYEIVKTKITIPREQIPTALERLERHFSAAKADRLDGLRLDWPDKWLLVRASNTEPIVRAIAEAANADEAQTLCAGAQAVLLGI